MILILRRQRYIHFTVKKNIVFLTTSSKGEGWKGITIFVILIQSFFNALRRGKITASKSKEVEKFLKDLKLSGGALP